LLIIIFVSEIGNKIAEEEAQFKIQEDDLKKKLDVLQLKRLELKSKRKPLAAHIKKLTRTFKHPPTSSWLPPPPENVSLLGPLSILWMVLLPS
jgi:hypothetical protein